MKNETHLFHKCVYFQMHNKRLQAWIFLIFEWEITSFSRMCSQWLLTMFNNIDSPPLLVTIVFMPTIIFSNYQKCTCFSTVHEEVKNIWDYPIPCVKAVCHLSQEKWTIVSVGVSNGSATGPKPKTCWLGDAFCQRPCVLLFIQFLILRFCEMS